MTRLPLSLKWLPNGRGLILQYQSKMGARADADRIYLLPEGQFRTIPTTRAVIRNKLVAEEGRLRPFRKQPRTKSTCCPLQVARLRPGVPLASKRAINDVTGDVMEGFFCRRVLGCFRQPSMEWWSGAPKRFFGMDIRSRELSDGRSILFSWSFHAG